MFRAFGLALLIITVIGSIIWAFNRHERVLDIQQELISTQQELTSTRAELTSAQQELSSVQQELSSVQRELDSAELTINSLESKIELYVDTWGRVYDGRTNPIEGYVTNADASNPTWTELLDFLLEDKTDQNPYVPDAYVCANFARDVHNNAERAGIRAADVSIELSDVGWHALNAFKTTDRGLVFIDCTGTTEPQPGWSYDRIVDVQLGGNYICRHLFEGDDWYTISSWGTILNLKIIW